MVAYGCEFRSGMPTSLRAVPTAPRLAALVGRSGFTTSSGVQMEVFDCSSGSRLVHRAHVFSFSRLTAGM